MNRLMICVGDNILCINVATITTITKLLALKVYMRTKSPKFKKYGLKLSMICNVKHLFYIPNFGEFQFHLKQLCLCSRLVITFSAMIFLPLVNWLIMLCDMALFTSVVATFNAMIFLPFMNILVICGKIAFSIWLVKTFRWMILLPFVNWLVISPFLFAC